MCGSCTRVQRGTCHVGSCSDLFTVLLFCLYFLAILVCNFACDLCCFIVNVYSVKSSLELMLYYFIMCRIKIKFSYLILLYHYRHGINLTIQEMQKKWLTPQFIGFLCVIMVNTHETHQLLIAALFSIDSN